MTMLNDSAWHIYRGTNRPYENGAPIISPPPPWRSSKNPQSPLVVTDMETDFQPFLPDEDTKHMVNAALLLRRPLLVTGNPGTGKTRLAYAVAHELNLGRVLRWSINTRSILREGLYDYDAVGRLHAMAPRHNNAPIETAELRDYIKLAALGIALLPWDRPRVVLVDEIDKSHVDLPNDLLHVFEEGQFEIPEIARAGINAQSVTIPGYGHVDLPGGIVACREFPLVIMTSNGEREFPAAFRRRCLELHIKPPDPDRLAAIVTRHFSEGHYRDGMPAGWEDLCKRFLERRIADDLATDQLMNAIYLRACNVGVDPAWEQILGNVLHSLKGA